jgi:F5/8 type C domain/Phage tail repeat like
MTSISDVWGLQPALDGKASVGHQHRVSDIEGLRAALDAVEQARDGAQFIGDIAGLQAALDGKAAIDAFTGLQTEIVATQEAIAGLQNYNGALDYELSIIQSNLATATSTNANQDSSIAALQTALDGKAETSHSHASASSSTAGFMSVADKIKLDSLSSTGSSENLSPSLLTYTVSQSSTYGSAATYANVTDNNFSTGGGTNTQSSNWIQFTFAAPTKFTRITMGGATIPGFGSASNYMNGASLEISLDGNTWAILIQTIAGITDTGTLTFAFSPITAKALRLRRQGYAAVGEFQVYG